MRLKNHGFVFKQSPLFIQHITLPKSETPDSNISGQGEALKPYNDYRFFLQESGFRESRAEWGT